MPVNESASEDEEAQLIAAAKLGEREAFDSLLERHGRPVLRFLKHMCGSEVEAEDLTQDVFYQAYRRMNTFQDGTNFRSWLLTIAHHTAVNSRRRESASEQPSATSNRSAIQATLTRLPDDQRAATLLRFGEGMSHTELAAIVKADPATVRWRLFKARESLRSTLAACASNTKTKGLRPGGKA